jgi:PPE-repeat protein
MWAQDAAAMYGYAGQSATASALTPFVPAPDTTKPAGLMGQAAVSTSPQVVPAVPRVLQALAQPSQSASGLSGILDDLGFTSVQSFFTLGNAAVPYTVSATTVNMAIGATHFAQWPAAGAAELTGEIPAPTGAGGSGAAMLASAAPAEVGGSAVSAGTGQASSVGQLSVPPGWAVAAPEIRTIATVLPMTGASVTRAVMTGSSGTVFSEMALAGMAGRAMTGAGGIGRQQHQGAVSSQPVGPPHRTPDGRVTSIAMELQKLAQLHGAGVLTADEFNLLKQRLLAP